MATATSPTRFQSVMGVTPIEYPKAGTSRSPRSEVGNAESLLVQGTSTQYAP